MTKKKTTTSSTTSSTTAGASSTSSKPRTLDDLADATPEEAAAIRASQNATLAGSAEL